MTTPVGVTLQQVGPIACRFDTPNIADPETAPALCDLPAGSLVLAAWAVVRDSFDDGTGGSQVWLYVRARAVANPSIAANAIFYSVGGNDPSPVPRDYPLASGEAPLGIAYSVPLVAQEDCEAVATIAISGGATLTKGEADVWFIIATPVT